MTSWFRTWHNMPNDPKWRAVARKAGVRTGDVIAVVGCLLDRASQADKRGSITGYDPDIIACSLDFETEAVEKVIAALRDKAFLAGDDIVSWRKHQPEREDLSTKRVKQYRERQKALRNTDETHVKRNETPGNAPDTDTDSESPLPPVSGAAGAKSDSMALRMEIAKAYGEGKKLPPDTGRVEVWLEQGYSLAMIRAVVLGGLASKQPRTLAYFDQPLADAAAVKAPEPPKPHVVADDTWRKVVKRYLEFGKWPTKDDETKGLFGPEPGSRGMKCPIHILSEFGIEVQKTQPG